VLGIVLVKCAATQVQGAVEDGDQAGIGIEARVRDGDAGEGAREREEGGEAREGFAAFGMFEETFAEIVIVIGEITSLFIVGLDGSVGEGEDLLGVVEMPAGAVEDEPAL